MKNIINKTNIILLNSLDEIEEKNIYIINASLFNKYKDLEKIKNTSKTLIIRLSKNNTKNKKLIMFLDKYKDFLSNRKKIYYIETEYFNTNTFIDCIKIILETDTQKRIKYIYDTSCEKLDNKFKENNYCDFIDDKCILQRLGKSTHKNMGCCYTFKYSKISGMPKDTGFCTLFDNEKKVCSTKCLTCKMFTCEYLKEKGIQFLIGDNFLIDTFFNNKQKRILKEGFFRTEEETLQMLYININSKHKQST